MAEKISIGDKVQAVDQVGRWTTAKVIAVNPEDGQYKVTFVGWSSEWNRDVDGMLYCLLKNELEVS